MKSRYFISNKKQEDYSLSESLSTVGERSFIRRSDYSGVASWKDELLNDQNNWNPTIISEPARRVLAVIREKCGTPSTALTPNQSMNCAMALIPD